MLWAHIMKNDWSTFGSQGNSPQGNDSLVLRAGGLTGIN